MNAETETPDRTDQDEPQGEPVEQTAPEESADEADADRGERPAPSEVKPGNDVGVDMLPGSDDEPVGPEDAAGVGPKRGHYEDRVLPSLHSHEVRRIDDPNATGAEGQLVENEDGGLDRAPHSKAFPQAPRFADRGDVPGVKGGVDTSASDSDEEYAKALPE